MLGIFDTQLHINILSATCTHTHTHTNTHTPYMCRKKTKHTHTHTHACIYTYTHKHTYLFVIVSISPWTQLLKLKTIFTSIDINPELVLLLGLLLCESMVGIERKAALWVAEGKEETSNWSYFKARTYSVENVLCVCECVCV